MKKKKFPKISGSGPFFELNGRRQTAVRAMIEQDLSDTELGNLVDVTDRTIRNWKHDDLIIKAKMQYQQIVAKSEYVPEAIKHLYHLMTKAKSEMVQLQSAVTILKMSGLLSENDTPELTKAKVRRANAEANISELKADVLKQQTKEADPDNDENADSLENAVNKGMKGLFGKDDKIET